MGCFGYICKGCHTPINGNNLVGGEKCVLIHARHGKELGRAEGRYDKYGSVIEQEYLPENEKYRGDGSGVNSHEEICKSEFELEDSYYRLEGLRVYKGQEVTFYDYAAMKRDEITDYLQDKVLARLKTCERKEVVELAKSNRAAAGTLARLMLFDASLESNRMRKEYRAQPIPERDSYSGTAAWHHRCYINATDNEKADLTPSETDPNQSWGAVRKKYL